VKPALALFVLAALLRLPWALHPAVPEADAADYLRLAGGILAGEGVVDAGGAPTAFRPPLYPLFLAALGASPRLACAGHAVIGGLSCLLVVLLARRLGAPAPAPWIAGAMLALDPIHVAATAKLQSEILYQAMLLGGLCLMVAPVRAPAREAAAGILFGLAVLTRAAAVPLLPVFAGWSVLRRPRAWRAAAAWVAGVLLAVAPWLVRNAAVMDAPVLTTQGGITLYSSYHPPGGRLLGVLAQDATVAQANAQGEVRADRELRAAAARDALADPLRTARLAALKLAFFWLPVDWEVGAGGGAVSAVYLFAVPLAALAAWQGPRRYALLLAAFAALAVFSAAVYGSPRLRFPYDPLLYVMAADALVGVRRRAWVAAWAALTGALWLSGTLLKQGLRSTAALLGLW
jgi:hypothetical protein